MPSGLAVRLCPQLIFVKGRFERYRELSAATRAIFRDETPLIEPPSLDEAYLDVTACAQSATAIARRIRARVVGETGLTCSAGVSYNKLIAKLASDENKPDGLTVIPAGARGGLCRGAGGQALPRGRAGDGGEAGGAGDRHRRGPARAAARLADGAVRLVRRAAARHCARDRRAAGAHPPRGQVDRRRAHLRRRLPHPGGAGRAAGADRRDRVGADRGQGRDRAHGDAEGQVRRLHAHHPRPLARPAAVGRGGAAGDRAWIAGRRKARCRSACACWG